MSEWISVKERMPERGKEVLARAFEVTCIAMLYGNHWFVSGINKPCDFSTVTHWMPLPEPPKEVE